MIIKSYLDLFKFWWELKEQRNLFILLIVILSLAAFLRFYKLSEYMNFLGDEGRDAIVIKNMLIDYNFPFIGPPTSVGNIYLGPLYYYMMAVPMAIFWLNPVAAAGMNAFLGVVVVGLIYCLGKDWFNREAGLIAAYLYAISPVTIIYSRSSWNPDPAPFFALISIFSLYRLHKTGNFLWLALTGFSVGAALQMHYLAAILIPITGILWLYEIFFRSHNKLKIKRLLSGTLSGISAFVLVMLPIVFFDLRHDFLNYKALIKLFSAESVIKADIFSNVIRIPALFSYNLVGRYIAAENLYLTIIVSVLIIVALVYRFSYWSKLALSIWLIVGLLGLTFYQQEIFDHYFGFMNPVPFLLLGSLTVLRIPSLKIGKDAVVHSLTILIIALTIVNFQKNPLRFSPNNQLKKTQEVARFIINEIGNDNFNFALLSKNNYDSAYQFYLDLYGHKPKLLPFEKTGQLFVICEDPVCDPVHSDKYEIAAFGWSKVAWMKDFYGVKIYKLIHNPSGKP